MVGRGGGEGMKGTETEGMRDRGKKGRATEKTMCGGGKTVDARTSKFVWWDEPQMLAMERIYMRTIHMGFTNSQDPRELSSTFKNWHKFRSPFYSRSGVIWSNSIDAKNFSNPHFTSLIFTEQRLN